MQGNLLGLVCFIRVCFLTITYYFCFLLTYKHYRYRLILHVSEGFDEQVKFLLFDILAQYLLQKTAFELAEEVAEVL